MDALRDTWELYVGSWKAATASDKRDLFARCLSLDCRYTDPLGTTSGWDELEAYMLQFHRQIPGGHFETTWFLAHHGQCGVRWNLRDGSGAIIGDGMSYGRFGEDGKLVAMTGFFVAPDAGQ